MEIFSTPITASRINFKNDKVNYNNLSDFYANKLKSPPIITLNPVNTEILENLSNLLLTTQIPFLLQKQSLQPDSKSQNNYTRMANIYLPGVSFEDPEEVFTSLIDLFKNKSFQHPSIFKPAHINSSGLFTSSLFSSSILSTPAFDMHKRFLAKTPVRGHILDYLTNFMAPTYVKNYIMNIFLKPLKQIPPLPINESFQKNDADEIFKIFDPSQINIKKSDEIIIPKHIPKPVNNNISSANMLLNQILFQTMYINMAKAPSMASSLNLFLTPYRKRSPLDKNYNKNKDNL